ncbi:hypothetical protein JW930_03595 [Candidatus Woesearchaeota archaeon]|nr:hypothetical protein [Candidatus Woesearchaeota archaeon]
MKKEDYSKISKVHNLPQYNELNRDFNIENIEEEDFLLVRICRKITEKIETIVKLLEDILYPTTSLTGLYESKYIEDRDKEKIYKIFKQLVRYLRYSSEVSFSDNEQENAVFVNEFYKDWQKLKPELQIIFSRLKKSWDTESSIKEDLSYLG